VYLLKDAKGRSIYIGKAKNLRSRILSYLSEGEFAQRPQIMYLMKDVADVDYFVTRNEREALVLENSLIKQKKPRYNIKKRVSIDFRNSIFRNRIFEIYDNLNDLKSIKELVDEGTQRACKDVMVNRTKDFEKLGVDIDMKSIVKKVRDEFPYSELPTNNTKARNFYTATICNMVADSIAELFL